MLYFPFATGGLVLAACSPCRDSRLKPAAFVHIIEMEAQIKTIPRKGGKYSGLATMFASASE